MAIYATQICRKQHFGTKRCIGLRTAYFLKHVKGKLVEVCVGEVLHGYGWGNGENAVGQR
jgi:hypothetical protein